MGVVAGCTAGGFANAGAGGGDTGAVGTVLAPASMGWPQASQKRPTSSSGLPQDSQNFGLAIFIANLR